MAELEMITSHERERYKFEIKLPNHAIEEISLEMTDTGFCISIDNNSQCFIISHAINLDESRAAYDGETLYLEMPIKFPIHGKKINIEHGCLDMGGAKHSCI